MITSIDKMNRSELVDELNRLNHEWMSEHIKEGTPGFSRGKCAAIIGNIADIRKQIKKIDLFNQTDFIMIDT